MHFLKKFLALTIYVSTYVSICNAQPEFNAFKVSGIVHAEGKNDPTEISVSLLRASDSSLVKVDFPGATGKYLFEKIQAGNYFIQTSHISFNTYRSSVLSLKADTVLPDVSLSRKSKTLGEVTISVSKPFIEQKYDKTVLNVENSIVSTGNTALDVLEKAPGVSLDQNEAIKMRGKQGVMVMIDGKRVPMSGTELATMLRGMPASSIERIELITNPSSKYDAEGNSGIIDIRLKKGKRNGTNGSVSSSLIQGKYTKYNESINFNHRTAAINLFGSYNYIHRREFTDLDIFRTFNTGGAITGITDQNNYFTANYSTHNYRAGLDYSIGKGTVIGIAGTGFNMDIIRKAENESLSLNPESKPLSHSATNSKSSNKRFNPSLNLNFKHTIDSAGNEITADLDYARFNTNDEQNYATRYFANDNSETKAPFLLYADPRGKLDIRSIKTDYVHPYKDKSGRIEAGLKSSWVTADNNLAFYDRSSDSDVYLKDLSNHFIYKERITAAYVNVSKDWKKWSAQLGLRFEDTKAEGRQLNGDLSFDKPYHQLFPSGYVGYKMDSKNEFGLSVSRRINRPTYNQLNPFKYFINATTYNSGNPELNPELSYSFDLNYTFAQKLNAKLGYSRTTDNIVSVLAPENNGSNVVIQADRNLASLDYYSLDISGPLKLKSWLNSVNNATCYYGYYSGNLVNTDLKSGRLAFNFNSSNSITLSKTLTAEISGNYESRNIYAFMDLNPIWYVSAGMQKQLLNKKASIKLSINDIFYSNKVRAVNTSSLYQERFYQQRDSRVATLNFSYRFGKSSGASSSRRTSGAEDEKRRAG